MRKLKRRNRKINNGQKSYGVINYTNGLDIEYTTLEVADGEIEVTIEEQDIQSELKFWENSLIMYVLGGELTMNAVKKFRMNAWNFVSLPELYYNEEGYFIIRLKSKSDKDSFLVRGPYVIYHKPMLLQEWEPDFTFKEDAVRVIPIWVIFHQLPLIYQEE